MAYDHDYPNEPIGGGNPYYRCVACKRSDPEINGKLSNHLPYCEYRQAKERAALAAKGEAMSNTTPAPTDALMPCPFCANQPEPSGHYAVICMGCGISGPAGGSFEDACAAWNRRAQPAASPAPVVAREPLTDGQCHALLEQMAEEADRWGEELSYEPTKEQVSRFCVEFILRKIAPSMARVPFTKPQRDRLFHNRRLASQKNMGVHLTLAEWHRIVQYIEAAHGITSKEGGPNAD